MLTNHQEKEQYIKVLDNINTKKDKKIKTTNNTSRSLAWDTEMKGARDLDTFYNNTIQS